MILIERTSDPVRASYLAALLASEGIEVIRNDGGQNYLATQGGWAEFFVDEDDAGRARNLIAAAIR